jgi:hypothetical protein
MEVSMLKRILALLCLATGVASADVFLDYPFFRDQAHASRTNVQGVQVNTDNNGQYDAFGKQRVSEPYTLFSYKTLYDKAPEVWSEYTSYSGTTTFVSNDAMVMLSVPANYQGLAIRQTRSRMNYQAGKSQYALFTGVLDPQSLGTNVRARVGYFTAATNCANPEGVWFEADHTNVYVCVGKPRGTGTALRKVRREDWNVSTGSDIDFTKAQILGIDMEWLGVGMIRTFTVRGGKYHYLHTFSHSNELVAPHLSTPNLPVRYEIDTGTNVPVEASSLKQICSVVMSEGGFDPAGVLRSIGNASNTAFSTDNIGILTGIRYREGRQDTHISVEHVSSLSTDNTANYQWLLCLNPRITNATTWVNNNTVLQGANPKVSGVDPADLGSILASGFASDEAPMNLGSISTTISLGASVDGTSDELYLLIRTISGTPDVSGEITIRELQ